MTEAAQSEMRDLRNVIEVQQKEILFLLDFIHYPERNDPEFTALKQLEVIEKKYMPNWPKETQDAASAKA